MTMLSGLRILSFTHFLQGPSASQLLADLGAEVIKIEPPAGAFERSWSASGEDADAVSPFFLLGNRNVRSMILDLKSPSSWEILEGLIRTSDVLIESYRPGAMERLGLGWDAVSEMNPRLIYCSLSGYGSDGPYSDRPGQDVLLQAMSGLAAATGRGDEPPTPVGACIVDQHGGLLGAFGILAALHGRLRTGKGMLVESNLLNAALDLQIEPLTYFLNGNHSERSPSGISSMYYKSPYGVFATADGFACLSLTSLDSLARVFEDEWFKSISEEDSFAQREHVNARIADHMRSQTTAAWLDHFTIEKVWCSPVNSYAEVVSDPQVLHNESFVEIDHPEAGPIRLLAHPVKYDGVRPGVRLPPPALGADTAALLDELRQSQQAPELIGSSDVPSA